jgi:hypothetical protein
MAATVELPGPASTTASAKLVPLGFPGSDRMDNLLKVHNELGP